LQQAAFPIRCPLSATTFSTPPFAACLSPISFRSSLLNTFGIAIEEIAEKPACSACEELAENLRIPGGEAVETPVDKLCESRG
jgi:hypothetical protein